MLLSLHGQTKDALSKSKIGSWEYDIVTPGYKCNMTDIMAALGLVQLKRYDKLLARRKEIIEKYDTAFENLPVTPLKHHTNRYSSCGHLYMLSLDNKDETFRNNLIKKLAEFGIPSNVHYKPLPMLTAYKNLGFDINDFPNAYNSYKNEITLPLHTLLTDEQVNFIVDKLKTCLS